MAAENNFRTTVESLFKGMDSFITTKTVVGEAITVGDTIILPLVDVSFGVGAGAGKSGGVCTVCLFCAVYGGVCSFDRGNGLSRRNPADFTRGTALCSSQCAAGRSFCSDAWESCAVLLCFSGRSAVGNCCEKIRKTQCSHMVSFCSQCFRFISGRHQRTWNLSFAGNQFRSSLGICHNR